MRASRSSRWRHPLLQSSVVGVLVCLMLGSGVIALTEDTVTSVGNHLESSGYTEPPPPAHDLELAVGGSGNGHDCGGAAFDTETVGPMSLTDGGVLDLHRPTGSSIIYQSDNYCIANVGTAPSLISVHVTSVQQTEVGCDAAEGAAEADETCGAVGELAGHLAVDVEPWAASGACSGTTTLSTSPFLHLVDAPRPLAVIEPGEVCVVFFRISFAGAEEDKVAVQTDEVHWDVVFTGGDYVGGGPIDLPPGGLG